MAEQSAATGRFVTRHGKYGSKVWKTWQSMRERCSNPRNASYPEYGGRGIRVCERWQVFVNFYADMGDPPDGYSIERIDVNGNYEPANCKWIPLNEQAHNRTSSRYLTAFGETKGTAEWLRDPRCKVGRKLLDKRLQNAWSHEKAITTPTNASRQGGSNHHASLTNEQAATIRARYAAGETNQSKLAREFGTTPHVICWLLKGRTYQTTE